MHGHRAAPHVHVHRHHNAGAFVAGAVIGAAAASNRNSAPPPTTTVVYQQQPGGYQQPVYATPVIVAQPQPPPKKKKNPLVFCIACIFIITIILCVSLIPWPGSVSYVVARGGQVLVKQDGDFIAQVQYSGPPTSLSLYTFDGKPALDRRQYSVSFPFKPNPTALDYYPLDLLSSSTLAVNYNWLERSCGIKLYVIQGESRMISFLGGGFPQIYEQADLYPGAIGTLQVNINSDERYFVVFYNPGFTCYPSMAGVSTTAVDATVYSTANYRETCTGPCTLEVPYPQGQYYLLDAATNVTLGGIQGTLQTVGRWYNYTILYVSLFVLMCVCIVCAQKAAKKHASGQEEDDEEAHLITASGSSYPAVYTGTPVVTPPIYGGGGPAELPPPSAPSVNSPPPYNAPRYDTQTGKPLY